VDDRTGAGGPRRPRPAPGRLRPGHHDAGVAARFQPAVSCERTLEFRLHARACGPDGRADHPALDSRTVDRQADSERGDRGSDRSPAAGIPARRAVPAASDVRAGHGVSAGGTAVRVGGRARHLRIGAPMPPRLHRGDDRHRSRAVWTARGLRMTYAGRPTAPNFFITVEAGGESGSSAWNLILT